MTPPRKRSCAVAFVVCLLGSLYMLFTYLVKDVVRDTRDLSRQMAKEEAPWDNNTIVLVIEDIIKGPEVYQEKLEMELADYIRKYYILPPSDKPYNLTKGVNPANHTGQLGQPRIINKILKGQRHGFFVECGGYDGEVHSNTLFFELRHNWTGLLIEPNSRAFQELRTKNRKANAANVCLSLRNYAQEVDFLNAGELGGLKELNLAERNVAKRQNWSHVPKEIVPSKAQCFPLFSLLLAIGNPTIDILSLDVEGAEMGVLQTIPWHRVTIRLILLEVNQGKKAAIDQFLDSKGYFVHADLKQDKIYIRRDQRESMNLNWSFHNTQKQGDPSLGLSEFHNPLIINSL